MKNKTLIAAAVIASVTATSAFAWWGCDNDGPRRGDRYEQRYQGDYGKRERGFMGHGKHHNHGPRAMEMMERTFTAEQMGTLAEARLLMRGNENLKVGKVTPTANGYNVTIVTKENSLVEEIELAKNGMRLEHYERAKARIEAYQ